VRERSLSGAWDAHAASARVGAISVSFFVLSIYAARKFARDARSPQAW
jgi:hypothetical protein